MVFDPAALEHVIQGGTSRVLAPTTGDEVITLQFHTLKTRSTHSHTLLGRVAGEEETSDVIVVYHDGVIHGSIARYADIIDQHLEYRILTDGHMMVRELDPTTMTARCGNGPDTEMADEIFDDITHDGFEIILQKEGEKTEESSDTADWRTVDIVVSYLDTVSGYYTLLGADLIAFILRQADGNAGVAYRPGRASITARTNMTSLRITFAHKVGHNFGCDHSWGDTSHPRCQPQHPHKLQRRHPYRRCGVGRRRIRGNPLHRRRHPEPRLDHPLQRRHVPLHHRHQPQPRHPPRFPLGHPRKHPIGQRLHDPCVARFRKRQPRHGR